MKFVIEYKKSILRIEVRLKIISIMKKIFKKI